MLKIEKSPTSSSRASKWNEMNGVVYRLLSQRDDAIVMTFLPLPPLIIKLSD